VSAQEQTTMATTTTTSSTTNTTSKRYLSNFLTAEAESTLSNVTSIHTQLQSSLYETQNTVQLQALDKHSALLQELHQRQLQSVVMPRPSTSVIDAAAAASSGAAAAAAAGTKTATILVSKSKTKTGLPLLLKNSINN
ncbi:hypothetical protein KR093_001430, partial [Drosophila rubida]